MNALEFQRRSTSDDSSTDEEDTISDDNEFEIFNGVAGYQFEPQRIIKTENGVSEQESAAITTVPDRVGNTDWLVHLFCFICS